MYKILKPETVLLTPEFVKYFAGLPTYKGDRNSDTTKGANRIAHLRNKFDTGKFHAPVWAVINYNGQEYRLNGGHSSKTLLQLIEEDRFPKDLHAHIDRYEASVAMDMAEAFGDYDSGISVRDVAEMIHAHSSAEEILDDVPRNAIKNLNIGVAYYFKVKFEGQKAPKITPEARYSFLHQHAEFFKAFSPFVSGKTSARLTSQGVTAAMFATWLEDPEMSIEFWSEVSKEGNSDPNSASRYLSRWLSNNEIGKKAAANVAEYKMRQCCHLWKKWLDDYSGEFHFPRKMPDFVYKQSFFPKKRIPEAVSQAKKDMQELKAVAQIRRD